MWHLRGAKLHQVYRFKKKIFGILFSIRLANMLSYFLMEYPLEIIWSWFRISNKAIIANFGVIFMDVRNIPIDTYFCFYILKMYR